MSARNRAFASTSTDLRSGCGWLAHRRAGEQARREAGLDRARLGRAGLGDVVDVARDQLHLVVDAAELDDLRAVAAIRPPKKPRLADAGLRASATGRTACRSPRACSSSQTLSSFCQSASRPVDLLGVLDHVGERPQRRRRRGGDRRRAGRAQARRGAARADRRRAGADAAPAGGRRGRAGVDGLAAWRSRPSTSGGERRRPRDGRAKSERAGMRKTLGVTSVDGAFDGTAGVGSRNRARFDLASSRLAARRPRISASALKRSRCGLRAFLAQALLLVGLVLLVVAVEEDPLASRPRRRGCGWRCGRGTSGRG